MRHAMFNLESSSPYIQKENGNTTISPMFLKYALMSSANFAEIKIPGCSKDTYARHFASGIIITDPIILPDTKKIKEKCFLIRSGIKRDEAKQEWKRLFVIPKWAARLKIIILDNRITRDVLKGHIEIMGKFIGVGLLRPQNGGRYGRFELIDSSWIKCKHKNISVNPSCLSNS